MQARERAEERSDPQELAELLITLLNRSFAGINDPHNHRCTCLGPGLAACSCGALQTSPSAARPTCRFAGVGPPKPVVELLGAVESALAFLMDRDWGEAFGPEQKRTFVAQAKHTHGRTALCLSGGGAVAM